MKLKRKIRVIMLLVPAILLAGLAVYAQKQDGKKKKQPPQPIESFTTNGNGTGPQLTIEFNKGKAHNHPLMAIWVEDTAGNYIQTLYVAQSIATGVFARGDNSSGQWTEGEIRRPAALPYWSHKRGIVAGDGLYMPTPDNPVPDAYSGATPQNDFILNTRMDKDGSEVFNVLLEINQSWDWNEYWNNTKYMEDYDYKTSSQPAVVYLATIDLKSNVKEVEMKIIGHSHYSGKDGNLYTDTLTLTTALQIAGKIVVKVE
jgi:hypothetical protein